MDITDEAVAERIGQLRDLLVMGQQGDGSWRYSDRNQSLGVTALVVLALKYSGLPNDHPAVKKGVDYIVKNKSKYVYAEGLVPCALELVDPKAHRDRIRYSLRYLMQAQNAGGNWGYYGGRNYYDNSCTQIAVLGLAAAERCGLPDGGTDAARFAEVRRKAVAHWKNTQGATGGWGYRGRGQGGATLAMTSAGIASLHLLGERLEVPEKTCGEYSRNKRMAKALSCLSGLMDRGTGRAGGYALYALERVGVFLNLRLIGEHDWYRFGVSKILAGKLNAAGGYASSETAFRLLFLAKGNTPIAIAKWRWNGDWNNDHGDVRGWVTRAGRELKRRFDWWESRLDERNPAAAKASMIFVNGHGRFRASEKELEFLRRFLLRKGTVVAEACCGRKEFLESFREVMLERLFPGQRTRFRPIPPEHPACSIVHDLEPEEVGALAFSVACRKPKMLLLTRDTSCALNGEEHAAADLPRARKVATNLLAWALLTREPKGKLSQATLEPDLPEVLTADQVARKEATLGPASRFAMGRLMHRGEWDVDRNFFPALNAALATQTAVPSFEREICLLPASEDLFHVPFVFMTGHEDPALKVEEYLPLRTYLQNGGFVFASNCCTSVAFDHGLRYLLRCVLPNDKLERVPPDDPLWTTPNDLAERPTEATAAFRKQFGDRWGPLFGIRREGRWVLVYSPVDVCCSLEGDLSDEIPAYGRTSSIELITNVIHRALSP